MQIETPAASVAVIIRTKDRPLLLSRALEDVLAQTFAQWVAVVVNDAGKPEAVDTVVANYADQLGDRVVVVHNAVSKRPGGCGQPRARSRDVDLRHRA